MNLREIAQSIVDASNAAGNDVSVEDERLIEEYAGNALGRTFLEYVSIRRSLREAVTKVRIEETAINGDRGLAY